ncbi:MAG: hypothetical protein GAK31_01297 [Stenotrophomonas maltophilia]|uniref:Uncharacterized protein n=1 Tax=Stenotrophomonas maltophilia TaxID=40324 RepID=A0A7V8FHH8_STEMA|nr:MAG: hypothetical protein GAK31_01297 [Stenotrophomonas maltophilia]
MGKATAGRYMVCALLPLLAVAGTAQAQYYGGDGYYDRYRDGYGAGNGEGSGIVRCESNGGRSTECALEGRPRLIRQLSNTPAWKAKTGAAPAVACG